MDFALIVAGGTGSRMQSNLPKQFLELDKIPVLMRTIHAFYRANNSLNITLVLPEEYQDYWFELCHKYSFHVPHEVIAGGESRFQSVKNGLNRIFEHPEYHSKSSIIGVHDGVRPLLQTSLIQQLYKLAQTEKAVIPAVKPVDSLRIKNNQVNTSLNRENVYLIQTPQVFLGEVLQKAYEQIEIPEFTDDASVVEKSGVPIILCEGDPINIKITRPLDLEIAKAILNKS